jgi:hypothetical protein
MSSEDDRIGAYVDDEMTPEQAEAFARAAAGDPALARRIAVQERLRGRLRGAYAGRLDQPPSAAVMRLLDQPRPVLAWRRPLARIGVPAGIGFALAASIALAVGLSQGAGGGDVAVSKAGALVARGGLAEALDQRLGTDADPKARIQLVESFRTAGGRYCRIFRTHAPAQSAGLACKGAAGWTIASMATPSRGAAADYRQAGSGLPRGVVAALDDLGLSQPLSAQEEQAARAAGWSAAPPAR